MKPGRMLVIDNPSTEEASTDKVRRLARMYCQAVRIVGARREARTYIVRAKADHFEHRLVANLNNAAQAVEDFNRVARLARQAHRNEICIIRAQLSPHDGEPFHKLPTLNNEKWRGNGKRKKQRAK